ncbi:MAG: ABC transporter permease [Vicinamibacteraceae bacterium]
MFDRAIHVLRLRWRSLVRHREVEGELADEIAYHLAEEADLRAARGAAPGQARHAALRAFGGVDRAKEDCREARGTILVESVAKDLRYGARSLLRQPAYAVPAVLTLALGIGATTAVFALVDGILVSRLPYPSPERLVTANVVYPGGGLDAARHALSTMDVAAYADGHVFTLAGDGQAVRVSGAKVSAELFAVLGVAPAIGRAFHAGEDQAPRDGVVLLSDALWRSRYGGDRDVIGRSIVVDGRSREVVGVLPASVDLPSRRTQLWVPLSLDPAATVPYWAGDFMPIVARLRPGVTAARAQAELRLFQRDVRRLFPWTMPDEWNRDPVVVPLQTALVGGVASRLALLSAAVLVVLIITCANVANLSLSRAATREREIGIRTAIGGTPRRVARQLLTEHVLLAGVGAACGFALAWPLLALLIRTLPPETPRLGAVALDWRALVFSAVLALLTGAAFGLAPVAHTLRLQLRAVLDSGGRSGSGGATGRVRRLLAVSQIAGAALLVISAGLLVRSLWALARVDPGFRTSGLVAARLTVDDVHCGEAARCLAFYRTLEDRLRAVPGVRDAALVNVLPLTGGLTKRSIELEGYVVPVGKSAPLVRLTIATPDYGRVAGLQVLAGRGFADRDRAGEGVVQVSAATARRFWPGRPAVGQHLRFVGETRWRRVIGVVGDVRAHTLTLDEPDWIDGTVYMPHAIDAVLEDGRPPAEMIAVLETTQAAAAVDGHLQRLARESSGLVVDDVRGLDSVLAAATAAPAATTSVLVATALLALTLGSLGVYAVLSFLVSRRTHEFGIRVALGALPRDVRWLVVREGAVLCAAGLGAGVIGALGLTRWLATELHGVSPFDPLTYLAVVATMTLVTLLACLVPTRRAMRIDPLIVLRDA